MLLSAEVRLFWFDEKPAALEKWFMNDAIHGFPIGAAEVRTDVYLRDEKQAELGVKTRGEKPGVEVKGLITMLGTKVKFDSYEIPIEVWSKWSSEVLSLDQAKRVALEKTRWLRKFDTAQGLPIAVARERLPDKGCGVEWTVVKTPPRGRCWTLGFEAFGGLNDIQRSLLSVAELMNLRKPPAAPGGVALSYPAWIGRGMDAHIDPASPAGLT